MLLEAQRARLGDQIAGHLIGLDAMDGLLHFGVEILDAHAQAIEAEAAQAFEVLLAGDARVDFDADLGVGSEGEALRRVAEQVFHLRGREVGRRAAAPVELHDRARARDKAADVLDFALERRQVRRRRRCDPW